MPQEKGHGLDARVRRPCRRLQQPSRSSLRVALKVEMMSYIARIVTCSRPGHAQALQRASFCNRMKIPSNSRRRLASCVVCCGLLGWLISKNKVAGADCLGKCLGSGANKCGARISLRLVHGPCAKPKAAQKRGLEHAAGPNAWPSASRFGGPEMCGRPGEESLLRPLIFAGLRLLWVVSPAAAASSDQSPH